ncbi:hypothetical protein [Flavobacterium nackdongense]|uniref:Exo-alpha-sialidase n=1 Tax=Flavobacterium nackdongense TaxID=2547394 RepID=A0A4P6YEV7_9FLAO|nr:hypothetical protein [Flavobacterium nackdongense]QBN19394.1 hypothetical protein E1750_11495 [Flavobacterium nackdongense]
MKKYILLLTMMSAFGQDISNLKVSQQNIKNLFIWNDLLIVEKYEATSDKYYVCDTVHDKLNKLQINNYKAILRLTETKSNLCAITIADGSYWIITRNKNQKSWTKVRLFSEFNNIKEFEFVANDSLLVIITSKKIFTKRLNSAWQEISMYSIRDNSWMLDNEMPQHCLLTKNSLYLGFGCGEWGGSLWQIPISMKDEMVLSKGKEILSGGNIRALKYTSDDVLWIATGLAHMGSRESGIYKYIEGKIQKVLWSKPSLSLKEESELRAFCLNSTEEPYFVASECGVFRIINEKVEEVIDRKQRFIHSLIDYDIDSVALAIYVDKNNSIFIAQYSLGIFVYKKTKDTYQFRQITFDE